MFTRSSLSLRVLVALCLVLIGYSAASAQATDWEITYSGSGNASTGSQPGDFKSDWQTAPGATSFTVSAVSNGNSAYRDPTGGASAVLISGTARATLRWQGDPADVPEVVYVRVTSSAKGEAYAEMHEQHGRLAAAELVASSQPDASCGRRPLDTPDLSQPGPHAPGIYTGDLAAQMRVYASNIYFENSSNKLVRIPNPGRLTELQIDCALTAMCDGVPADSRLTLAISTAQGFFHVAIASPPDGSDDTGEDGAPVDSRELLWRGDAGRHLVRSSDPSFTRWLPLMFSPSVSNQPVRTSAGSLPAPWGNIHCVYSIALQRDTNPDLAGVPVRYTVGNLQGAQPISSFTPAFSITDAGGNRLVFNASLVPYGNVRSQLVALSGGGYELRNAGPPSAMAKRGFYTYAFEALPTGSAPARLVSIRDDCGNQQTFIYGTTGTYLVVSDITSGRQLLFYTGTSGYVEQVVAPVLGGIAPATRTTLAFDGSGHLTGVQVFSGTLFLPVRALTYTYSVAYPDAVENIVSGPTIQTHSYSSNAVLVDPYQNPISRISQVILGSQSDFTSSSNPLQSIVGLTRFTYGADDPVNIGYKARTNSVQDARGNVFSLLYSTNIEPYETSESNTLKSTLLTTPPFTGSGLTKSTLKTQYYPNIVQPDRVVKTDNLGRSWEYLFDAAGNATQVTDPLSHFWQYAYTTDLTRLTAITDPTQLTTQFNYGENGSPASRLTSVTDPAGRTRIQMTYNQYGQIATVTTPSAVSASGTDETTAFTYHPVTGDLTNVADSDGGQWTATGYDALGDLLGYSLYLAPGISLNTSTVYDASQTPTQITLPSGKQLSPLFNNGGLTGFRLSDVLGNTLLQSNYQFDSRGRLYKTTDLVGIVAEYRYDLNSNVTQVIDGRGNTTTRTYGPNNELVSATWPGGADFQQRYDGVGRLRQTIDERGITTDYDHDDANRTNTITTPNETLTFTRDPAGRLLEVSSSTGNQIVYTYSIGDKRLQSVTTVQDGYIYTVSYTYNGDGSISAMTSPVGTTTYSYVAKGRLALVQSPFGEQTSYDYDLVGRLLSQTTTTLSAVSLSNQLQYGPSGQSGDPSVAPVYLQTMTQQVSGQVFQAYTLTHSHRGEVLHQAASGGLSGIQDDRYYSYDGRGRLASDSLTVTDTNGQTTPVGGASYTYDLADNLYGASGGWAYNTNNQLTGAPTTGGISGGSGLAYDAAGNLTSLNGMTLIWDDFGRLEKVEGTSVGTVTYTYDLLGRRATKSVNGQLWTRYLYSGSKLIAEAADYTWPDGETTTFIYRAYTWGANGLISDTDPGSQTSQFYFYDPAGNTRALVGADGNTIQQAQFSSWGEPDYSQFIGYNTMFGWQGRHGVVTDVDTGLLRMGARWYAPNLGRFVSRDPIGYAGGPNLYVYCNDDPINLTDPTGLSGDDAYSYGFSDYLRDVGLVFKGEGKAIAAFVRSPFDAAQMGGTLAGDPQLALKMLKRGLKDGVLEKSVNEAIDGLTGTDPEKFGNVTMQGLLTVMTAAAPYAKGPKLPGATLFDDGCFVAGTPVQVAGQTASNTAGGTAAKKKGKANVAMPSLTKSIEQIRAGDLVASRDEKTGKPVFKKVTHVWSRTVAVVLSVSLADAKTGKVVEQVTATRNHPFFVAGKGWIPAGGLAIGNTIVTRAGPGLVVKAVKWLRRPEGYRVYNFEVADTHSYFVGTTNGGAWVHNSGTCDAEIFLGLGKNFSSLPEDVRKVASSYQVWESRGLGKWRGPFDPFFKEVAEKASKIHFNLDGLDIERALNAEINFNIRENVTNSELNWIRLHPHLADKTTFYLDGGKAPAPW